MAKTTEVAEGAAGGSKWAQRFFVNVVWGWVGVVASFLTGFFLSPYIVRKLGDQRYGIWALTFAFIEYVNLFDFGFKTACVNLISKARAREDDQKVNEIVNTSLFYFIAIAFVVFAIIWTISGRVSLFFKIGPAYTSEFIVLIRTISLAWVCALAMNGFVAIVEAFQRFRQQSQYFVVTLIIRSTGCVLMLYLGYGLVAMGVVITLAYMLNHALTLMVAKQAFPAMRISPRLVRRSAWKEMASYGVHGFVAYLGQSSVMQGPPILIGHLLPSAFVGYYALPSRLMQYLVELVTRIASVTMPNTAELLALGLRGQIVKMAIYLNRYCFALFVPFTIFLLIYGRALIQVWVGPEFAAQAAPLLLPLVVATSFATAGQYNSIGILYGIAKHDMYAKSLIVEAVCLLGGIAAVTPHYGITGAAWVTSVTMILNRGFFTPLLLCRRLELNVFAYMSSIYTRPLILALPSVALGIWMKSSWLPGGNWRQVIVALAVLAVQYYAVYLFAGIEMEHRRTLLEWVSRYLRVIRTASLAALRRNARVGHG